MKNVLIFIPIILIFLSCPFFFDTGRQLKDYEPEKAGAIIEETYDITEILGLTNLNNINFSIAEYSDSLYIYVNNYLNSCSLKTA
ncbi:MAG: hypothetical protein FWD13_00650 [Treponema sp.]|nr:hypothetical protein [Treponema sp.]